MQYGKPHDKEASDLIGLEDVLARLRLNDARKTSATNAPTEDNENNDHGMDKILEDLNNTSKPLKKQAMEIKEESESDASRDQDRSSGSDLFTPATDSFDVVSRQSSQNSDTIRIDPVEILKVKEELAAAKAKIAQQDQELAETRNLKHTMDQAIGSSSEAEYGSFNPISESATSNMQSAFNASARPLNSRTDCWSQPAGSRPSTSGLNGAVRGRVNWNNQTGVSFMDEIGTNNGAVAKFQNPMEDPISGRPYAAAYNDQISPVDADFSGLGRTLSGSSNMSMGFDSRGPQSLAPSQYKVGRYGSSMFRSNSTFSDRSQAYPGFPSGFAATSPPSFSPIGLPPAYSYSSRALGTPLSPVESDYSASALQSISGFPSVSQDTDLPLRTMTNLNRTPMVSCRHLSTPSSP